MTAGELIARLKAVPPEPQVRIPVRRIHAPGRKFVLCAATGARLSLLRIGSSADITVLAIYAEGHDLTAVVRDTQEWLDWISLHEKKARL